MKTFSISTSILAVILFSSCASSNESKNAALKLNAEELIEARALFQTHCYACHTPKGNHDERVAPPMIAIKRHYINENTTQAQFVADVSKFVSMPSTDLSKMPGALRKFGMMLPLKVPEEDLTKIAKFIYQQDIEAPEWFEEHYQQEHGEEGQSQE
jgi:cytochrome c553